VLIGGGLIYLFDIPIIDPILTVGFTLFILWGVVRSMREVANVLLQGVPAKLNLDALKDDVKSMDGVIGIHDVHVWSLEGKTNILTAHVVVQPQSIDEAYRLQRLIKDKLHASHNIDHSTIELETEATCTGNDC
jgi:cobalt-zinc-cadmium efflux system protein